MKSATRKDGDVTTAPSARFGGTWASGLQVVAHDVATMTQGRWAVSVGFAGDSTLACFAEWGDVPRAHESARAWAGPLIDSWTSSMDEVDYCSAVESVRDAIARGDVYQVNICRILTAPLPHAATCDIRGLDALLAERNPAPYGGYLDAGPGHARIACASPELFLSIKVVEGRRIIRSGPIKGTGRTAEDLLDKDSAENIMIVDLVRNDLSKVCKTGSVRVPDLLKVEEHPGLVHLVSYVEGELRDDCGWPEILEAAFPPGSVTGAPKLSALRIIADLEPTGRGPYCGAFGWVDADTGEAELAVAIRTFWIDDDVIHFGTGAGITWGSDPRREWEETMLKADRLITAASRSSRDERPTAGE